MQDILNETTTTFNSGKKFYQIDSLLKNCSIKISLIDLMILFPSKLQYEENNEMRFAPRVEGKELYINNIDATLKQKYL